MSCCKSCAHGRKCEGKNPLPKYRRGSVMLSAKALRRFWSGVTFTGRRKMLGQMSFPTTRSLMALEALRAMKGHPFPRATRLRIARRALPNPLTKAEVKRIRGLAAAALHGFRRKRGTHLGSVRRGAAFAYLNVLTHVGGRAAAGKAQASLARLARRANPNFLFLAKNGKRKRRNPDASNNWIYQPNGRKRRKIRVGPLKLHVREFESEKDYLRDWDKRHAIKRLPARSRSGRFKKGRR